MDFSRALAIWRALSRNFFFASLGSCAVIHLPFLDVTDATFVLLIGSFRGDLLTFLGGGAFHQQHQES
jgi:hypothetical protein